MFISDIFVFLYKLFIMKNMTYEQLLASLNEIRANQRHHSTFNGNVQAWLQYGAEIARKKNEILQQIEKFGQK